MSKRLFSPFILAAAIMAAGKNDLFAFPRSSRNEYASPRPKDLPRWKVDGHTIYAKDEKTALKYAKKRGFWKEGVKVIKEDKQ